MLNIIVDLLATYVCGAVKIKRGSLPEIYNDAGIVQTKRRNMKTKLNYAPIRLRS